jgi:TolA-binding protein
MTSTKPLELTEALDLSIRARRGTLRAEEQRALEQSLEASALVRTAHEIGRCFDATNVVRPGDDALIARAAAAALVTAPARGRPLRSRFVLALAASLAVATAATATGVVALRHARGLELERRLTGAAAHGATSSPTPARRGAPERSPAALATSEATAAPPLVESAAVPPAESPARTRMDPVPAPSVAASHGTPAEKTAASLFRDASAARRAGELATATALFSELSARFPGTNEARVSQVSLGKLLLGAGRASDAEAAFSAYLRAGAGDLTEEALVGRANALSALGKTTDERRAWAELVARYGSSVYRARAQARIEALDAAAHASDQKP